jgi:hypothetical protein
MKKINKLPELKKDPKKVRVPLWTLALMVGNVISKESVISELKKNK